MKETKSYKLLSVRVKCFEHTNYLSLTPESEIIPIEDIGTTAEIIEDDLKEHGIVKMEVEGEIDTITYIDQYESCVQCNSKVKSLDSVIAESTKCGTMMKRNKCQQCRTAKVCVTATNGQRHSLTIFNDVINDIIGKEPCDPARDLLMAPAMKFNVDTNKVVYSIQKL